LNSLGSASVISNFKMGRNDFRTHLYRTGLISKKEMERLPTHSSKDQFLAFAAYFEAKSPVELFDTAAQVYSHWEGISKETNLSHCLNFATVRWKLTCARALRQWQQGVEFVEVAQHFTKLRDYIKKLLQKNKELSEGAPKQIIVASPKVKSHSYLQKAAELLSVPNKPPSSMNATHQYSISGEWTMSPKDAKQNQLYDRLYSEAKRKQEDANRKRAEREAKIMEECTFSPEVRSLSLTRDSVFERLTSYDSTSKNDFHVKQRESRELEGCTFAPSINQSVSSSIRSSSPHERLYKLAATQKQALRHKELKAKAQEVEGCTFKPEVKSRRKSNEGDVYQKLYNHFEQLQKGKRVVEAKAETDFLKTIPFSPQINSTSRSNSQEPAHERLYKDKEKQQKKLEELKAEHDRELKAKRSPTINRSFNRSGDIPVYERLYSKSNKQSPAAMSSPEFTFKPKISQMPSPLKRILKSRAEQERVQTTTIEAT